MFKNKLIRLITESGGIVEDDLFVIKPGCMIIKKTELTSDAIDVFNKFNIPTESVEQLSYEAGGEFNARLCYLSFKNKESDTNINDTMIELNHLSVYGDIHVGFLIAGISDEVLKEFVSHTEARVSRLTSSKTAAASDTLYRIFGDNNTIQNEKQFIKEFITLRNQYLSTSSTSIGTEQKNMFNLGTKASACTFSMSVKDYHKLFIGRMKEAGNEHDIRLICSMMCEQLHSLYPKIIRDPSYYLGTENGDKLKY